MTAAVASATPSMMPTVTIEAPSTLTRNTGRRLWISSEETSMNSEPNPNAQMPAGKARHAAGVLLGGSGLFEGGECMCRVSAGAVYLDTAIFIFFTSTLRIYLMIFDQVGWKP